MKFTYSYSIIECTWRAQKVGIPIFAWNSMWLSICLFPTPYSTKKTRQETWNSVHTLPWRGLSFSFLCYFEKLTLRPLASKTLPHISLIALYSIHSFLAMYSLKHNYILWLLNNADFRLDTHMRSFYLLWLILHWNHCTSWTSCGNIRSPK